MVKPDCNFSQKSKYQVEGLKPLFYQKNFDECKLYLTNSKACFANV